MTPDPLLDALDQAIDLADGLCWILEKHGIEDEASEARHTLAALELRRRVYAGQTPADRKE